MPEPLRFVYHLGVHKTGTSLLQHNLARNGAEIAAQGVWCLNTAWPNGLERVRHRLRRVQNQNRMALAEDAMASLNERLIRQAEAAGAHSILVSEENFLGNPIHRELEWRPEPARFCPRSVACLKTLTWGIPQDRIRIILYTRELDGLLRGHYSEALRALRTGDSFGEFLDRVDLDDFRFDRLLDRIRAAVPGAEIVLRRFETISDGPAAFVRDFMRLCHIGPDPLRMHTGGVNPSLDADQAEQLRWIYWQLQSSDKPRRLRRRAMEVIRAPADRRAPILVPPTHRARINAAMAGDLSLAPPRVSYA